MDPQNDDEKIASVMAASISLARKYDSEQRTTRGAQMSDEECWEMEKRNVLFMDKCKENGILW